MKEQEKRETNPYDLVVVGSSAGGIEALSILVETLPDNFPAPVVLAQHLDPTRPSNLDQILQKHTSLPVEVVTTSSVMQAGKIYVVPANHYVSIQNHLVKVKDDNLKRPLPSVDTLLSTAAQAYGEHLIAIILTGTGSDGALGSIDVKNAGGIIIVQNPQTARYPSMPLSLPPTIVDYELNVEDIGPLLYELLTKASHPPTEESAEDILPDILEQVSQQASIDFRPYKTSTILRRIGRRIVVTHTRNMRDYVQYLKTNPEEVGELVKAFLINVTQFFRDSEAFAYLRSAILPKLIAQARQQDDHVLRFWAAGCATGEEPYSLGMLLADLLGAELLHWNIKIFATDLDEAAINFARRGVYSEALLKGVPDEYRERFFEHTDQGYRISKSLRQIVIFGHQDLGRGAPFPHINLVLCRNVLIYFTPELQDAVLSQFAFSLYPDGYLFLGKAETVRPAQALYELVNKQWKMYRCIANPLPLGHRQHFPVTTPLRLEGSRTKYESRNLSKLDGEQKPSAPPLETSQLRRFNEVVLRTLTIGIVVIDRSYHIVTANGAARRLLGLREIGPNQDFLHAVRGVPYQQVRTAIDTVFRERNAINLEDVELESLTGESGPYLNLSLSLMQIETDSLGLAIISITDVTQQVQVRQQLEQAQAKQRALTNELEAANKRLTDINNELRDTNEGLQTANDELLMAYEELQASIEEFETTNEELQATNEELETNNEELQATNEELETTNDELCTRTNELQELTKLLTNERARLAKMVELAPLYILVLRGPDLIVEAYNPHCAHLIANRPIQGQPLEKVTDLFWETGLEILNLARDTYHFDAPLSRSKVLTAFPKQEVREQTKAYFTYTAVPSHDANGKIDGVAIYALDETEKRLQEEIEEHNRMKMIFDNLSTVALALYDAQTSQLMMGSPRYLERAASVHHLKPDELIGRNWQELTLIPSQEQAIQIWQTVLEKQTVTHIAELSREICPGVKIVWDNTFTPIMDVDEPGMVRFMLVSAVDVTEQVRVRKELVALGNLKDDFLSMASHELRSPLTAIQGNAQLLQRDIQKQKKAQEGNTEQEQRLDRDVALLDKIVGQTRRMNELITEMLDTARIRGQAFELKRKEDVNIVDLIHHVIAQYAYQDQKREIVLCSEEKLIPGSWDENRIEQVLHNLITNALKYSPADKPIVVEVQPQSENLDNQIIVSVQDQGSGIPEKDQAHIFERFYRAGDEKREGLGLGLYISHEIVTRHGGRMWVKSSPGKGSTFYFSLPLKSLSNDGLTASY